MRFFNWVILILLSLGSTSVVADDADVTPALPYIDSAKISLNYVTASGTPYFHQFIAFTHRDNEPVFLSPLNLTNWTLGPNEYIRQLFEVRVFLKNLQPQRYGASSYIQLASMMNVDAVDHAASSLSNRSHLTMVSSCQRSGLSGAPNESVLCDVDIDEKITTMGASSLFQKPVQTPFIKVVVTLPGGSTVEHTIDLNNF